VYLKISVVLSFPFPARNKARAAPHCHGRHRYKLQNGTGNKLAQRATGRKRSCDTRTAATQRHPALLFGHSQPPAVGPRIFSRQCPTEVIIFTRGKIFFFQRIVEREEKRPSVFVCCKPASRAFFKNAVAIRKYFQLRPGIVQCIGKYIKRQQRIAHIVRPFGIIAIGAEQAVELRDKNRFLRPFIDPYSASCRYCSLPVASPYDAHRRIGPYPVIVYLIEPVRNTLNDIVHFGF